MLLRRHEQRPPGVVRQGFLLIRRLIHRDHLELLRPYPGIGLRAAPQINVRLHEDGLSLPR